YTGSAALPSGPRGGAHAAGGHGESRETRRAKGWRGEDERVRRGRLSRTTGSGVRRAPALWDVAVRTATSHPLALARAMSAFVAAIGAGGTTTRGSNVQPG